VQIDWIVYGDLDQPTGGYVYDRLVVDGLRAAGDAVTLVDPRRDRGRPGGTTHPGMTTGRRPDLIVGDALCAPELGPLFEQVGSSAGRVLLVHHMPSWELEREGVPALRRIEARAARASDAFVTTGVATAARLAADYPDVALTVVAPGADRLPARAPRGSGTGDAVRLLFVGSLVARKRVIELLDAFEPLAGAGVSLVLAGDPGREPDYARAVAARVAAAPALRANVTCAGVLGDDALADALAEADALVLPSSLEGYGMALVEALQAGTPVIASQEAAAAAGFTSHAAVAVLGAPTDWTSTMARVVRNAAARVAMRRAAASLTLPRWADAIAAFREALTAAAVRRSGRAPAGGHER
jgi:glycosyltransferase involved in cell wall biosynthesis